MRFILYGFITIALLCAQPLVAMATEAHGYPGVAFYYGAHVPVDELHAFDVVVVDPAAQLKPKLFDDNKSHLYAYVSLGEWPSNKKVPNKKWVLARNRTWQSLAIDQTSASWRHYFLNQLIKPLVKQGYHGVFLDTVDSYHLFAKTPEQRAKQERAIIETLHQLKQRFPKLHVVINRGFEVVSKVANDIDGVAVESMYRGWNHGKKRYQRVSKQDRFWVQAKMQQVKQLGLWPIVIDYVDPVDRETTQATADKIKADGFIPWVANGTLTSLGVGSVTVVPRRIAVIYDSKQFPDITVSDPMRFAAFPLEQMGYVPRLYDVQKPLPDYPLPGRVAAILVWINGQIGAKTFVLDRWLEKQYQQRVPITLLGSLVYLEADKRLSKKLGMTFEDIEPKAPIRVVNQSKLIGFETPPYPADATMDVVAKEGQPQITIEDANHRRSTPVSYMPWGGFAMTPFVVHEVGKKQAYWVLRPFQFLKRSLQLPAIPVADMTTKNGLRMMMVHVDGDGWVSKSEWFKGPIAARSMLDKVLLKYRIPSTISVVEGEVSKVGPYPDYSEQAMAVARDIYKLPWVELASHTFSHPFKWRLLAKAKVGKGYNLDIPGYRYNPEREITGSVAFIDKYLAPNGKRCKVLLWSGDTNPDEAALAVVYKDHLLNMNGGDTLITERNKTLTSIAPIGIIKGKYIQIYAPNQNENVYTNDWKGPFYGFRDVIQTFKLTESPHRYKPIDIYYHTYSASKKASLRALYQVYDWALQQPTNKIYSSEYIRRAMSFYHVVVAKNGVGWLIRNIGEAKEYRVPQAWGYPVISKYIMGYNSYDQQSYIHANGANYLRVQFASKPTQAMYIKSVNGSVSHFSHDATHLAFDVKANEPIDLILHGLGQCRLQHQKKIVKPVSVTQGDYRYHFKQRRINALTAECSL